MELMKEYVPNPPITVPADGRARVSGTRVYLVRFGLFVHRLDFLTLPASMGKVV